MQSTKPSHDRRQYVWSLVQKDKQNCVEISSGFKTGSILNSTQGGVGVISYAFVSYLVFGASIFFFCTRYIFTPSKLHHACQSILMFEETSKVAHNQDTRSRCREIDLKCKGQQIPSARGLWTLRLLMHAPFQIKILMVSSQHFITSIVSFHNHSTGTKRNGNKMFCFCLLPIR